jgi:hypothetical protein
MSTIGVRFTGRRSEAALSDAAALLSLHGHRVIELPRRSPPPVDAVLTTGTPPRDSTSITVAGLVLAAPRGRDTDLRTLADIVERAGAGSRG